MDAERELRSRSDLLPLPDGMLSSQAGGMASMTGFTLETRVAASDGMVDQCHRLLCMMSDGGEECLATFGSIVALKRLRDLLVRTVMPGKTGTRAVRPSSVPVWNGAAEDPRHACALVVVGWDGHATLSIHGPDAADTRVTGILGGAILHGLSDAIDRAAALVDAVMPGLDSAIRPHQAPDGMGSWEMLHAGAFWKPVPPLTLGEALIGSPGSVFLLADPRHPSTWHACGDVGGVGTAVATSPHGTLYRARDDGDAMVEEAIVANAHGIVVAAGIDPDEWSFDPNGNHSCFLNKAGDMCLMHDEGRWQVWDMSDGGDVEGPWMATPGEALAAYEADRDPAPSP